MTISKTLTLGLLGGSLLLANAAQAEQKLLPAQSEIGFVSKQMGVPVEGRFKKFDAQIAFDPKKPEDVAEVRAACEPTAKQYESLRRLAYVISLRTSVPYDDLGIVGHCQSGGTHGDPKAFDWRELGLSNAEHRKSVGSCRWFDIHP